MPSNVTGGLICYTGTPNAMPVGATASLAAYTPHNVTDYLDAKSAAAFQIRCCIGPELRLQAAASPAPVIYIS